MAAWTEYPLPSNKKLADRTVFVSLQIVTPMLRLPYAILVTNSIASANTQARVPKSQLPSTTLNVWVNIVN